MKRTFSLLLALLMVLSCAVMPVTAATDIAAEDLVNLYDFYQSSGDMVAEDGTVTSDTTISSNSMIPVTGGEDIYLGPYTEGTVYLATYDADGEFIASIPAADCSVVDTLVDGSVIYSYTTDADAAYVWVAAENTYAMSFMLTEGQPFDGTLLEAYHAIDPLEGKKALFIGDSITHGVKDTAGDHYGWAGRIGDANNMDWTNNGQSGYSVSTCRVGKSDYDTILSKLVLTKYESFDYVLLHGGVNDIMDKVAIGTVTEGYDPAEFDVSTFAGGLEDLFYNAYYCYGRKAMIGYIVNFDLPAHRCGSDLRTYFDVAKEICEKWNVRYFDMLENTKVSADLKVSETTYLPDTLHPNTAGYDILAPMIEGFMKTLTKTYAPDFDVPEDDGKVYNVTFADDDGTVLATTTATRLYGIAEDAPAIVGKGYDGIVLQRFLGWSVGDDFVDVPDRYDITSDVTFTAVYNDTGYGARFEETEPIVIGDGSAPQELLPEAVKLDPDSHGITFVYKVEGAESQIIADDWYIYTNNNSNKKPASQWGDSSYSLDGFSANHFELSNGYFYVYVNQNLNGTNAKTPEVVNSFSLFNPHTDRYDPATARDPENTNTGATFRMLAVTSDNLQPTVTFHGADGELIGSYQHKYTDIHRNLGYGTSDRKYSLQEGQLLSPDAMFALTGYALPEAPEGTVLIGWSEDPDADQVVLMDAIYYNCDLYPVFVEYSEDDYKDVTFLDYDGKVIFEGQSLYGKLTSLDYPATCDRASDGVYYYRFKGWTVDGENVIEPANYEYKGGEVIKPLYTVYGKVYTEPTPVTIPTDTSTEFNMLGEEVLIPTEANGVSIAYKVEGVDAEIIADSLKITTSKYGNPAGQWNGLNGQNKANYTSDGDYPYWFELNNGYFYIYVNENLNGMNAVKTDDTLKKFAIYGTKANDYVYARTPVNTNENAQVSILAVVSDNLQPTATFYDALGNELASYQHQYTNVNSHLGWGNGNPNSVQEGNLLTIDEVVTLAALETPTKAPTHNGKVTYEFDGWVDAEGNAVEALYYNVDLYPSFKIASDTRETYTVKFVDEDGSELYSTTILEGETPVYGGEAPAKAADKKNTYDFAGWDAEIVPAAGNVTYKATYKATEIIYTVTFMNGETEVAKSTTTYEGAVEVPADPTKDKTAQYTYTFDKWVDAEGKDVDFNKVTDNITVYAKYTETVNQYTIIFMTEDKTEISRSTVDYGTAVTAPEAPAKEATEEFFYVFSAWVDENGTEVDLTGITADITVYPHYLEERFSVAVTFMNGEEVVAEVTVKYGEEVDATKYVPEKATECFTKYTFAGWVDAEGNAVDLTKVEADMTVYASYTTECEHNFPDIKEGEWYEAAVEWALMNGVMNGEGSVFNPNKATTRGMIVTVLYRLEGSPDVSAVEHPFTDIKEGAWYYDAVKWAYAEEVVNGMSPTTYAPTSTLTREQFATILYRYASELKGEDVSVPAGANLDKYTDKGKVSDYAFDAVLWTNVKGYISGTSETTLSPKGSATRAQMATILYRYITAE